MDIKVKVLEYIEQADGPVSAMEISEALGITRGAVHNALSYLIDNNKVIQNKTGTRKVGYYISKASDPSVNEIRQDRVDYASEHREEIERLEARINEVEEKEKRFYSEMVSIMAIFVAIFALIITNVDIINNSVTMNMSNCELFKRVLIIDIPVVVSIIVLMLMVKVVTRSKSKKSKKRKDKE